MIPRFESFEDLPSADLFRLARGRERESGRPVLIKTSRDEATRAIAVEYLRRESEILAGLGIAGIPGAAAHGLQADALVIDDPGGVPLASLAAAGPVDLAAVLAIGIELAGILAQMHSRGLVHNGIRPDAVLWDAEAGCAWLIDFSAAGAVTESLPSPASSLSPARLAYVSPEQTGRMNRTVDHRSDLYSLGALLYELSTGAPPFRSDDSLELIHWHIAKTPLAPAEADRGIPEPLSEIVMRLLAKTAEDRYRGARGLLEDLKTCAERWAADKRIPAFALGRHDAGDQFIVSQKLYGRDEDVARLLRSFERVCRGETRRRSLTLVAGYSGIGKTSLIQELYKPIVRQRGYFISGKFDQVRSVPFGALIQALRGLVRQLLTESEARLARWRSVLTQALGANGGVLADVIPEIEVILGKQPLTVVLGPTEALNRFQMVFQNFFAALARPDHPLVVFLDDLQWADAATLSLLEPLLTSQDIPCLFLMGAYRDNEVDALHPLSRTLVSLESAGVEVQRIVLGPLRLADLTELIRDTLQGESADAEPLAQLVLRKTGGNPFFVTQFLKTLKQEGYFEFDPGCGRWTYRTQSIAEAPLTDNVIDLMSRKIQRLLPRTQRAITLAACIGSVFDRETLAVVSEQSPAVVAGDLREAVREGLILSEPADHRAADRPSSSVGAHRYSFLHDRVQQSAYALIPAERKQAVHLAVGRLLRSQAPAERLDERIFDIVHHLNLGRDLISGQDERIEVASLNLRAGCRAKASTAYEAALGFFQAGLGLLDEQHWRSDYELVFALHLEAAESEYLCGRFDAAERQSAALLQHAATNLDKARVCRLRSLQYENMSRYSDALASAGQALALFGIAFPQSAEQKEAALDGEIAAIHSLLGGRSIASLVDLPLMSDPEIRMVMNIMTEIWGSAYLLGDPLLARLISATLVRLSLTFGNVEESAYGYVTHAITVGPVRQDYRTAHEFGRLALAVNERLEDAVRRAKIYQQFQAHVNFWCQPLQTCIPYAREAWRSGLESGDLLYAAYGAGTEPWAAFLSARNLEEFVRDYTPHVALVNKLKNTPFADSLKIILNWARALQGKTRTPLSLSSEEIDEDEYLETYRGNAFFTGFHAVARLYLCYLFGEYPQALDAARRAREVVYHLAGTVWPIVFDFWNGLTLAANYAAAGADERASYLEEMEKTQRSFALLAENCPENFRCQSLLLSAELERIAGRHSAALDLYELAITYAGETDAVAHLALANELCARFRLERGQRRIAALFMAEARASYAQWGATAKVAELDRGYPELLGREAEASPVLPMQVPAGPVQARAKADIGVLDLVSVMKAAQAITSEIELDRLLARLMSIAIENAGAERGALILEHQGEFLVQAAGSIDDPLVRVHQGIPIAQARELPASIVNYVLRTSESIVLAKAQSDDRFSADPYVARHAPRSVMCLPVIKQGRLVGILYLENNVLEGAFTPERIQVMQLLSAEAAISLENAKLFDGLRREIQERKRAQEELRTALTEVGRLKNELEAENVYLRRDMIANVSHDLRTPLTSLRGYLETLLMKEDSLSAAERHKYLGIAARQGERLAKLVDELFELARLESKGTELDLEPMQLGEFAGDVTQKFQLTANEKAVRLTIEASDGIPLVDADAGLMERVFDNLISNALRYTPAGGHIGVRVAAAGERVSVCVADTGSGIPEAEIPFIFNRFYRADKSRHAASENAGLGLAITKRILEMHGGEITVESAPLAGTRFSFSLPLRGVCKELAA